MNRIEIIRDVVDNLLLGISDLYARRTAYVHLYGVSQVCAILATKRKENVELATIAGMLHDISAYTTMDTTEHAHKSAIMSKELLVGLNIFTETEIDMVCSAIYNPLFEIKEHEKNRYDNLVEELNLDMSGNRKV